MSLFQVSYLPDILSIFLLICEHVYDFYFKIFIKMISDLCFILSPFWCLVLYFCLEHNFLCLLIVFLPLYWMALLPDLCSNSFI